MNNATPRPWKAARVTFGGQFIAGCGANEANAALIVRAVKEQGR